MLPDDGDRGCLLHACKLWCCHAWLTTSITEQRVCIHAWCHASCALEARPLGMKCLSPFEACWLMDATCYCNQAKQSFCNVAFTSSTVRSHAIERQYVCQKLQKRSVQSGSYGKTKLNIDNGTQRQLEPAILLIATLVYVLKLCDCKKIWQSSCTKEHTRSWVCQQDTGLAGCTMVIC